MKNIQVSEGIQGDGCLCGPLTWRPTGNPAVGASSESGVTPEGYIGEIATASSAMFKAWADVVWWWWKISPILSAKNQSEILACEETHRQKDHLENENISVGFLVVRLI